MSTLPLLPILIPLAGSVLLALLPIGEAKRTALSITLAALLLAASGALLFQVVDHGPQALQVGNWQAPFGITIVADLLSAILAVVTGVIGLAAAVYASAESRANLGHARSFHVLFHLLLAGICGAFLTGDLFNLYVWFEILLIASMALLVLGGGKERLDGAVKYAALNLVSTLFFLAGIGILFSLTGSLNMADLHIRLREIDQPHLLGAAGMLLMVAFGIKAAMFPLFFWLPASYHTLPTPLAALFAGMLTKVGVYALIRTFTLILPPEPAYLREVLAIAAALTMITGVLGAAAQNDIRRILSFHIISQVGYMVLGLALFTPLALAGAVFYLVHHIIVKANLFLVGGVAKRLAGSTELPRIGGLYKSAPLLCVLFLIPAFSLAGFPPLSGFWAKLLVVKASLDIQEWLLAAAALVVGLLTIFSMTKIWQEAFWKPHPDGGAATLGSLALGERMALILPIAGLALITVLIGIFPGQVMILAEAAAATLLDPRDYLTAVGLAQ